jgi:hypothetical protein
LLQVFWEQGYIEISKLSSYTLTGRKNEYGNADLSMSLRHLTTMCPNFNFLNEQGMLEHVGATLGVKVMLTPNVTPKLQVKG